MALFSFTVQNLPTNSGDDNVAFNVVITDASDASLNDVADKFVATLTSKNGASATLNASTDGFQSATVNGPFVGQETVKIPLLKSVTNVDVSANTTYVVAVSGYKSGAKIAGPAAITDVSYENSPIQNSDYSFIAAGQDKNIIVTLTDINGSPNSLTSAIIQLISMDASAEIFNETVYLAGETPQVINGNNVYEISCNQISSFDFVNGVKYETAVFGRNATGSTRTVESVATIVNSGANPVTIGTAVQPAKDVSGNNIFKSFTIPVSFSAVTGNAVTDLSGTISDGTTSVDISFDITGNNDADIILGFTSGTTDISNASYQLKNVSLNAGSSYTVSLQAKNSDEDYSSLRSMGSAVLIQDTPTWNLADSSLNDALTNVDLLLDSVIVAKLSNISDSSSVFYNDQGSDASLITLELFDGSDASIGSQTIAASALSTDVSFTDVSNVASSEVYLKATLQADLDNGTTVTSATLNGSGNKTSVVDTSANFTVEPTLTNDSSGNLTLTFTLDGRGVANVNQITDAEIKYYVDTSNNSSNAKNNASFLSAASTSNASFDISNAEYGATGTYFTVSGESLTFSKTETLNALNYGHRYYATVTAKTANGVDLPIQSTDISQSVVDASISMIDVSGDVFTATRNGNALNTAIGLVPNSTDGITVETFSGISTDEFNYELEASGSTVQVGTTLLTSSVDISGANPDFLVAFGFGNISGVMNEAGNLVNAFQL